MPAVSGLRMDLDVIDKHECGVVHRGTTRLVTTETGLGKEAQWTKSAKEEGARTGRRTGFSHVFPNCEQPGEEFVHPVVARSEVDEALPAVCDKAVTFNGFSGSLFFLSSELFHTVRNS